MYPVSAAYKEAIKRDVRDTKITGTITLKDNSVINIVDTDIMQGSLYVSEQCVSGEDLEVGNVYASELGLALKSAPENPYTLDGARIALNFGINTEADPEKPAVWEYVPLGYYYVTEIERKDAEVTLKALDGMMLLDVDLSGVITTGIPYALIQSCCTKAGITLATSAAEFEGFANYFIAFTVPEEGGIETCRDLIMWVCQMLGAFARMNRMGQLDIVPIAAGTSVKTISKAERYSSDISDSAVKISGVAMRVGEENYSRGSDAMILHLEENPLLLGKSMAEINTALVEILGQVSLAEYVPASMAFAGDPTLQAGDRVTLAGSGALSGDDVECIVTHSNWRYRGPHEIRSVGKSALVRGVNESQQQKAVSSIRAIAGIAHDLARAAKQSTQLINDAIGGHVLIRQASDETNEILIMDHPDPEQATKIWRWNMGGLGYSDNVAGADNPLRQYDIAMTMDGAINANFIKSGKIAAQYISVGPETVFEEGYDPIAIKVGGRNLVVRHDEIKDKAVASNGTISTVSGYSCMNDFIPVFPGDGLTFSQVVQSGAGTNNIRYAFYSDQVMGSAHLVRYGQNSAAEFGEVVPEGAFWLRVSYATKNKVQLERGNRATDWTPSPEDVDANAFALALAAREAAEAVARAEATLAQAQAEAYADGIVSVEEQARLDEAAANLAAAKAHAEAQVDALDVGGRNLALNSRAGWASTAYNVIQGTLSENWVVGETYTVTLKGTINAGQSFRLWRDIGSVAAATLQYNAAKGLWARTFECPAPAQTPYNKFSVYNYPSSSATSATVEWLKIERGNKFTDWSPAPEDLEQALADHNANSSPHNLPSYAKMEDTGFKVYDNLGNLRTHMGQYAPGEFGSWVDAGHYMIRDKGMDMSLTQLPNLMPDHSFECLERSIAGGIDITYHDWHIAPTGGNMFEWNKSGSPRLVSTRETGVVPESAFGLQCIGITYYHFLYTYVIAKPNTQYTLSGFCCRGYRTSGANTPRLYVDFQTSDGTGISTNYQDYTTNAGLFNWKRVSFTFTTPANCGLLYIVPYSATSNYVYWDGIQLVEGGKPVRYDPEENLWRHMFQVSGLKSLGHLAKWGSNAEGYYAVFQSGLQVCWDSYGLGTVDYITRTFAPAVYGGRTDNLSFPIVFGSTPSVVANARSNGYLNSQCSSVTTTGCTIRTWANYPMQQKNVTLEYIATGW